MTGSHVGVYNRREKKWYFEPSILPEFVRSNKISELNCAEGVLFYGGKVTEQKFEDAFQKLESIVKKLEDGNLSLEESLKVFEEGVRLSRLCSKKLDEAEKKVEILLKESNGRLVPKAFALEEEED